MVEIKKTPLKLNSTGLSSTFDNNKVGTIQSVLSGIAAGLIDIPKGAFSLGASLMDMGFGTNNAAQVESFFDDLTTFDEKAEATAAGKLVETLVNIGVPGGIAFKQGQRLAKSAVRAMQSNTYFKPSKALVETAEGVGKLNVRQAGLVPVQVYSCGNCGQVPKQLLESSGLSVKEEETDN